MKNESNDFMQISTLVKIKFNAINWLNNFAEGMNNSPYYQYQKRPLEVLYSKVFLKVSEILQENTCVGVSFLI